jgi:hypothetical protein
MMRSSTKSVWRVLQYPVGLLAAFGVSIFAALVLMSFSIPMRLMHGLVGFLGVFLASFCFMRSSRLAGSIFLLVAGVGFFYFRFVLFEFEPGRLPESRMQLAFMCVGAAIAVISHAACHLLFRRNTHDHAT